MYLNPLSASPFSNLSFWEHNTWFNENDIIIVGAGITGLTCAIFLRKKYPKSKILVIERGILPSGASTKNAGFACFGSPSELLDDINKTSVDEVAALVKKRFEGFNLLLSLLGKKNTGYNQCGGFEVFRNHESQSFENCVHNLEKLNKIMKHATGIDAWFRINPEKIAQSGFGEIGYIIESQAEGGIDTGLMMQSLFRLAINLGIYVIHGIEIDQFTDEGTKVSIGLKGGHQISCSRLVIATNAFASQLLPEINVIPGRAQVLITSKIPNLKVKGTFHYDRGYYFFRNVSNRILIGGGRNLDFKGEETSEFGTTSFIQEKLESLLRKVVLPGVLFKIEHRWSGIMGLGADKSTIIRRTSTNIVCAVRMGGMGVALGSAAAKQAADLVEL